MQCIIRRLDFVTEAGLLTILGILQAAVAEEEDEEDDEFDPDAAARRLKAEGIFFSAKGGASGKGASGSGRGRGGSARGRGRGGAKGKK